MNYNQKLEHLINAEYLSMPIDLKESLVTQVGSTAVDMIKQEQSKIKENTPLHLYYGKISNFIVDVFGNAENKNQHLDALSHNFRKDASQLLSDLLGNQLEYQKIILVPVDMTFGIATMKIKALWDKHIEAMPSQELSTIDASNSKKYGF